MKGYCVGKNTELLFLHLQKNGKLLKLNGCFEKCVDGFFNMPLNMLKMSLIVNILKY
jgi:hypothetical protein